jgi:5-methyltetrahydropteroyltriglutamate--homocysteine methyltransferase
MKIETTLSGSYPKLPTEPSAPNVRVVRNRMDQGKATERDLREAIVETTRRILALQDSAGIDIPVDGQVAWDDEQTHVARALQGFEIAGLIRYLDTNTYYRQPEIVGSIEWVKPITVEDWKRAQEMSRRPLKAVLPGPYSLYRFSKDRHYKDPAEALRDLGVALAREAKSLEDAGATWIHFEEPWLGRARAQDAPLVKAALLPIFTDRRAKTVLHVPFRAPTAVFPVLCELGWTALGLDLVEAPEAWELIPRMPHGRTVALGLIDARNTKLEDAAKVAQAVARARAKRKDLTWQLCPTASLEYLPADKAALKVSRLVEAARLASRNGG